MATERAARIFVLWILAALAAAVVLARFWAPTGDLETPFWVVWGWAWVTAGQLVTVRAK